LKVPASVWTLAGHRLARTAPQTTRPQRTPSAAGPGRAWNHALAWLKNWKIHRDCRLKGSGVHQAMLGIVRLHNMALTR
jgi:hypothetical protein